MSKLQFTPLYKFNPEYRFSYFVFRFYLVLQNRDKSGLVKKPHICIATGSHSRC